MLILISILILDIGIGLDSCSPLLILNSDFGKDVIIFGVDNSSLIDVNKKEKDILVLGEEEHKG